MLKRLTPTVLFTQFNEMVLNFELFSGLYRYVCQHQIRDLLKPVYIIQ
jgi:hypothetical protein